MYETKRLREKIHLFFVIFIPIFITQIGLAMMNFFNTMMSGQVSPNDLAGVAIGGSIWAPIYTGLSGILLAVTPIVSQLIGARRKEEVPSTVIHAIYLSFLIAFLIIILGAFSLNPILQIMNLDKKVQDIAFYYLLSLSFGIVPLFVYQVLRSFIDALGQTRTTMFITLLSVPINLLFNYLLVFGKFGFPKLGGIGAGVSTAITYWIIAITSLFIVHKKRPFSTYGIFRSLQPFDLAKWKELFKIGFPIGMSIFFETSIFAIVTLLMSQYDTYTIASHQASVNFTSILYMFPLSVSMGLTILVAFENGAKRFQDAKQYSWLGLFLSVGMAVISSIILFMYRYSIADLYTNEKEVLELTASFLLFALCFQVSDAIQAPVQGALRGYKDVNSTFITTLLSYWVIGLPTGYLLATQTNLGPYGYWIGLITGLTCGAIGLSARLIYIQKRKFK